MNGPESFSPPSIPSILRGVGITLMGFGAAVAPATSHLWLETNFANANVRYNASLVWSIGIACLIVHRVSASARAQEERRIKGWKSKSKMK